MKRFSPAQRACVSRNTFWHNCSVSANFPIHLKLQYLLVEICDERCTALIKTGTGKLEPLINTILMPCCVSYSHASQTCLQERGHDFTGHHGLDCKYSNITRTQTIGEATDQSLVTSKPNQRSLCAQNLLKSKLSCSHNSTFLPFFFAYAEVYCEIDSLQCVHVCKCLPVIAC